LAHLRHPAANNSLSLTPHPQSLSIRQSRQEWL
jgi:hypothetical protein